MHSSGIRWSCTATILSLCGAAVVLPLTASTVYGKVPVSSKQPTAVTDAQIAKLIEQLGAPQYLTREKAELELEQLGLRAFDALKQAQSSDDVEIALRARYLVRNMRVHWALDSDSTAVKQILARYGQKPEEQRRVLMQQLATLGMNEALLPLCRLAKYEQSSRLSRRAALFIIEADVPKVKAERAKLAGQIDAQVASSKRAAAQWLRAYVALLRGTPDALAQWRPIIKHEVDLLEQAGDAGNRPVIRDLMWWYADQLEQDGKTREATRVLQQSIQLLDSNKEELLATVDRFRTKKSWRFIVQVADRFPAAFRRSPLLMYRLADAQWQLGNHDAAEQAAQLAHQAVPDEARDHLLVAANLQHDGLFKWAEKEYRGVVEDLGQQAIESVTAQSLLCEMLHDLGQEERAGKVLQPLVDALKTNKELRKQVNDDLVRSQGSVESRMYYFFACAAAKKNQIAKERELLSKAIACDPTDADVLIAMYRLPNADKKWRADIRKRIKKTAADFKAEITKYEKMLHSPQPDQRILAKLPLATACNQYAWLVANTEGDFAEAIRMSQRSLALRPNTAGYLDTLGHCYYANGDYKKAVEAQMKAAVLEPNSPQILAKLELFKKALAQQAKTSKSPKKSK